MSSPPRAVGAHLAASLGRAVRAREGARAGAHREVEDRDLILVRLRVDGLDHAACRALGAVGPALEEKKRHFPARFSENGPEHSKRIVTQACRAPRGRQRLAAETAQGVRACETPSL